jgi:hypothetical protein
MFQFPLLVKPSSTLMVVPSFFSGCMPTLVSVQLGSPGRPISGEKTVCGRHMLTRFDDFRKPSDAHSCRLVSVLHLSIHQLRRQYNPHESRTPGGLIVTVHSPSPQVLRAYCSSFDQPGTVVSVSGDAEGSSLSQTHATRHRRDPGENSC